uniref:MIP33448p1 n=1 Tax=Drosophila melanogaster TaxID=7227 RepID=H1UUE6_DROME|nr:MIP33448p1 [Drosophila melanogaster]
MAPCAPPVARTPRPCCGTSMTARTCTLWSTTTSSTPCASRPTATGCAWPTDPRSRSGIWHARRPLRSCAPRSFRPRRRPISPSACPWPGPPTARLCSPATPTTPSASGRCLFRLTKLLTFVTGVKFV